jgi:conjugal transfer ATP-binding protein TraC
MTASNKPPQTTTKPVFTGVQPGNPLPTGTSNPFLSKVSNDRLAQLANQKTAFNNNTNAPVFNKQDLGHQIQKNSKVVGSFGNWRTNPQQNQPPAGQKPSINQNYNPQKFPPGVNPPNIVNNKPINGRNFNLNLSNPNLPPRPVGLTAPHTPLPIQKNPVYNPANNGFVVYNNNQPQRFQPSPVQNPNQPNIPRVQPVNQPPINQNSRIPTSPPVNQIPPTNNKPQNTKPKPIDPDSPEYLKSLNPTDLRREVIKTEIEIQKALIETEKAYREGVTNIRDLIAPSGIKITTSQLELNTKLVRSFFVLTYPRVITSGWLEGLVNADIQLDISIFIYPRDSSDVLRELKGKVGKIQASLQLNSEQGKARDPQLETAYRDVEGLRDAIQQGVEKFFRVGVYIQIYANTQDELEKVSQTIEGILSQQNIISKRSALQMDDGFNACLPILKDDLDVVTNMNTSPLSACFPFVSSDLSSDSGILYGINRHNSSLIIFDRFELENANSLVFATSGAGKSYAVKLEILRSRMLGVGVIVIDPEQEYKVLADSLGGAFINMSLNSTNRINPFDLPKPLPGESTGDIIRTAVIDLMGLMNLMLGKLNPTEVSIMEKAIQESYAKKDITNDSDLKTITPPTMSDLVEILEGTVGGESLAQRLYRYTEGTFAGIFNKPTNINIDNDFIVFSIRDLQETLRPIAMYILLKYVWTEIRSSLKKRILAIDEAWILMQYEDSARFLYGLAKRARKYYLGITTISQDVTDFLSSPLGKPIVTNAAMKLLLKQSSAAIDQVADTFALTGGEKQVLLQSEIGQGIFFAGPRHVAIEIIAFPTEHKIITTNPKDILKMQGVE